jgi:hypothetical protein
MSTTYAHKGLAARRIVAAIAGFLLVSALIVRASDAAFTAEYLNEDNEFSTGVIDLDGSLTTPLFGDEVDGDALVHALDLKAGDAIAGCIDVTYSGSYDAADLSAVTLSVDGAGGTLADALEVTVEVVDNCTDENVAGTPVDGEALSGIEDVDTGWTPSTDEDARGFLFTVSVPDDNDLQGEAVTGVTLRWDLETT